MVSKLLTGLIALVLFAALAPLAPANDKDKDKNDKVETLTGCLRQGDGAKEFTLMAKDGSTWELRSDKVNLAPHVGQTVTITGTRSGIHAKAHEMKEAVKEEAQEHGMAKNEHEHGHLKVTRVSKVSASCQP